MALRRVRMIDVAQKAGVSRTTASFVLNGRSDSIPEETRKRVIRAATRLGYRPNANARALVTGRTHRLGIVLNEPLGFDSGDPYFTELVAGFTTGALKHDHDLLLHCARHPNWRELYDEIIAGSADGILLTGAYLSEELTRALLDAEFPTVCISYRVDHPRCHYVDCDNVQGGYIAARHLLALGHNAIGLYYPGDQVSWGRERREGALKAIREAGLPDSALPVLKWEENDWDLVSHSERVCSFIKNARPSPTALIACDEGRALRLSEGLPACGFQIPMTLSLVCFNSTAASERARPPLTSVWQPLREIGAAAVDTLIELIEGRPAEQAKLFEMRVDVRESTATPN